MFGTVPATPHIRLPMPSTLTAPCTARKSSARRLRHDTRWVATALLMVLTVPTMATNRNAGRSAQKDGPNSRSNPGHCSFGRPIHDAAPMPSVS